jgi:hypothetical protein
MMLPYFFRVVTFILFTLLHCSSRIVAFVFFALLPLPFSHCYIIILALLPRSSHIAPPCFVIDFQVPTNLALDVALVSLVGMVLLLPSLPCVGWSLNTKLSITKSEFFCLNF